MADTHLNRLEAQGLTVSYDQAPILDHISLAIPDGRITALIGANGCGKSTLLRTLARIIAPSSGQVLLDGKVIASLPGRDIARKMALLPQNPVSPEGLTVRQLCRFGRHPHRALISVPTPQDEAIVEQALCATQMQDLAERDLAHLSGGQRQRAWIAMALAQQTPLLLLDEPTTYLDIAHQLEVLELLRKLNQTQGRTIIMVLHDLNHAAEFAHHLVAIADHRIYATGSPADLLTPDLIRAVFNVDALVVPHPHHGTPLCLPLAKAG